jgi:hypothetical protein
MRYVNCGAYGADGKRVKTKKQLREELATSPGDVYFDSTSMFDSESGFQGDAVPEGLSLSVVMPDPYTDRRSYASVTRRPDGALRVS